MKLIVGLGNPGKDYENTRHNVGFQLIDFIAKYKDLSFKNKFNALYTIYDSGVYKYILIKPLSYMNLSGTVVKKFIDYYKVDLSDILIVHDDLDMSFGRIKFVFDSSSGGHNGIKDIEKNIGTKRYLRLKIGISNDKLIDTKDYVLGNFSVDEKNKLSDIYEELKYIIDDFGVLTNEQLMSKYNKK